ncbi:glutaredoxin domain-containing protein [Serinicoccus sediminis]|uniref:glutaredoxin domain-containing protein n=1 Tax=Serinicoccus sediminis TaxID=2306021 RepID=UPI003B502BF6
MRSRWWWAALVVVLGLVVVDLGLDGRPGWAVGYGVLALGIAWWTSPWRGRRGGSTQQEVAAMAQDDPRRDVVIYWRPGCGFCAMLKTRLGGLKDRATWVNIWEDEDAAAFVRSVNDGNETVPTVVMDGIPVTNPNPGRVKERLARG